VPAQGETTPADRFRVLSVDGGGIRGLIAARVLARLEELISEEAGEERQLADCFHMFAGTSTGGLIALGLTVPDPANPTRPRLSAADLVELYETEGPKIFGDTLHKLLSLGGWIASKHSEARLERALRERFGEARLRDALRELIVTSYDMSEPGPHFFKRWRARESAERDVEMVDVGLSTSAAPTYFPSHGLGARALVDGGLFAANPSVAAVVEALKRRDEAPHDLSAGDLLLVSLGTGQHETGHPQSQVRRWGRIGWILPRRQDPALIAAFLDGQSDAADHWVEILLNHVPGRATLDPVSQGAGPHYFRFQTKLEVSTPLDDASPRALSQLNEAADRLISDDEARLREVARRLASGSPLPA
jgi:patatin-like phospholipase/acyl hydrolase